MRSEARNLGVVGMFDQAAQILRQPRRIDDDFLVMDVDDRIEWNAVTATILVADKEFSSTPRSIVPDRAELRVAILREHLKPDGDRFLPLRLLAHVSFLPRVPNQQPA